jgi:hypothetical protein
MYLFRIFALLGALIFVLAPALPADNAMPWGEQEAERDAQEEETFAEKSSQEEMSSSIYGRITGIDLQGKTLDLLPTDQVENEELEEDDDVTAQNYRFKSNTPLTGLSSFNELSPGDYVTLEYYAFQNSNRITEIVFDKHGENENAPAETQEAPPGVLVG